MDTRDTPEQAELRRAARRLAHELGPVTVAGLDDGTRAKRLAAAVRDAGWLELRDDDSDGAPVASGVEVGIVADALGGAAADVAFAGPVLAADLARRAGLRASEGSVVAFGRELLAPAIAEATSLHAVDPDRERFDAVYVLEPEADGYRLAQVEFAETSSAAGTDLTRALQVVDASAAAPMPGQLRLLT